MKNKLLSIFISLLFFSGMVAQESSLAYLNQQCPQLTQLYREELKNCHAHYIFAVDVSLSMCRFEQTVRPALEAFVKALPMGDRVTIIPFAHDAISNKMGYDVTIDAQTKNSMVQMLSTLYPQGADRRDRQYYDTDIYKAQQAVAKSVQMNQQYDVNIIVFISDLLHCPENNIDRQFNGSEMGDMHTLMKSAYCANAESMIFTLELPQSGKPVGYVFPQLKELYDDWGVKVEQQDDDLWIPYHDHYEVESFIDGTIMTIADAPWPGLTPDLLSVLLVVATQSKGSVLFHQKMFESRLFFTDKLIDMGAQIILCDPHRAVVVGHDHHIRLRAGRMTSPDIRAGIALLIAAMSANGTSRIDNIEQIDRGYENIEARLNALGAKITRLP
jgi:hypothetical protein